MKLSAISIATEVKTFKNMKKLILFFLAFPYSLGVLAQNERMGNNHGNSNGNFSFSVTEMLLGGIFLVLVVALLMRVFNNSRNGK